MASVVVVDANVNVIVFVADANTAFETVVDDDVGVLLILLLWPGIGFHEEEEEEDDDQGNKVTCIWSNVIIVTPRKQSLVAPTLWN